MREDIKINDRALAISDQLVDKLQTVYDPEIELDILIWDWFMRLT